MVHVVGCQRGCSGGCCSGKKGSFSLANNSFHGLEVQETNADVSTADVSFADVAVTKDYL